MTAFQLDENSSDNSFRKDCNKDGLATVRKYPTIHKGLPDPEMLGIYMCKDGVLVTFDSRLVDDHQEYIPVENPGIITITHSPAEPKTVTINSVKRILKAFKAAFDDWHTVKWQNALVTLTESTIEVCTKSDEGIVIKMERSFADSDWPEALRLSLAKPTEEKNG